MASEEVDLKIGKRMVEVWASTADALLQDWIEKGIAGDRLGMTLTSAKLAQLGHMIEKYFTGVTENLVDGSTEVKACNQAIAQIDDMVRRAMAAAGVGGIEQKPEPALMPKPDSTLN